MRPDRGSAGQTEPVLAHPVGALEHLRVVGHPPIPLRLDGGRHRVPGQHLAHLHRVELSRCGQFAGQVDKRAAVVLQDFADGGLLSTDQVFDRAVGAGSLQMVRLGQAVIGGETSAAVTGTRRSSTASTAAVTDTRTRALPGQR